MFRGAGAEEAAASKDDDNDEEPAPVQPPTPEQMSAAWTADDIAWTSRQVKFTQLGWPLVGGGACKGSGCALKACEGTSVVVHAQSGFDGVIYCSRDGEKLRSVLNELARKYSFSQEVHYKLAMEYALFANAQLSMARQAGATLDAHALVAFPLTATRLALAAFPLPEKRSNADMEAGMEVKQPAGKPMGTGGEPP